MIAKTIKERPQILYTLMWATVIVVHFFLLKSFGFSTRIAWADSLIFNILFLILGTGLWFMVKYSDLNKKSFLELFFYHLTSLSVVIFIWAGVSYLILKNLFTENVRYLEFLSESLIFRIISGFLYYVVMVTMYYLIINFKELKERKERESQLTSLLKEAELNLLRSQIRPHFLFNSLNSVSSLTMTDPGKAQEMVIKLSEFMRYSLDAADRSISTLEKELNHVDLYLDIEKVRFGDRLVVEKAIDPLILDKKMPAMILQPLLENAVKFGVYESTDPSVVKLEAKSSEGLLVITVGNPYDEENQFRKGTGTGLKNIEQRMTTIYGRRDLIRIEKRDNYYEIELKIPEYVK